jgi:hypothetical protein
LICAAAATCQLLMSKIDPGQRNPAMRHLEFKPLFRWPTL